MAFIKELEHLRIPFRDIQEGTGNFTNKIGRGGYGPVYKGKLTLSGNLVSVAVKRQPNFDESGQGIKEFLTEINLLSRYKHPNLVSLVGFCEEHNEKILVYEYAERGSFDNYLKTACSLTWRHRLNICVDAARGLDYLHNRVGENHRIIHRDIKSANILLDGNFKAKIADLGLSKVGRANEIETFLITDVGGTLGYCDPEYFKTWILTKKSDVYSFGVVLFEALCGRLCIISLTDKKTHLVPLARSLYEKGRLNVIMDLDLQNSESVKEFSAVAYQCLNDDPKERPSMDLVLQKLEKALELIELDEAYKLQESEEACILQKLEEVLGLQKLVETLQEEEVLEALILQEFEEALEICLVVEKFEATLDLHKLGETLELETDYRLKETIYIMTGTRPYYISTKDIYTHLSSGILLAESNVWFSIDKNKKNQEMIPAMTFMHPHPNKCKAIYLPESRFPMVARILNASKLNMQLRIRTHFLSSEVTYAAYLVYKHETSSENTAIVSLKYKLNDQSQSYISYHGECKAGWVMMELFQTSSLKRNVEFIVLLESFFVDSEKDEVIVEGIMFLPIQKVADEINSNDVENPPTTEIEWEKRLPSDYANFLKRSWNFFITKTKEEAYSILSKGVHIKVNSQIQMWFWITKYTGKKCFIVSPNSRITDFTHKKLEPTPHLNESRLFTIVLLKPSSYVSILLEIKNHLLSVNTAYACYLVYKISQRLSKPLCAIVKYKGFESPNSEDELVRHSKIVYLTTPERPVIGSNGAEKSPNTMNKIEGIEFPRMRKDGWWEVKLAEFMSNSVIRPRSKWLPSVPYASEVAYDTNKDEEVDDATTALPTLWPYHDRPIIEVLLRPLAWKRTGYDAWQDLCVQGIEFRPLEEE